MRIVHGSPISPYVRKVLIALEYKGLSYENKSMNPFIKSQALFALNPLGKIPIYQEGDFLLPDSTVICAYLERQYPQTPIYPSDAQDYALSLWYETYIHEKIAPEIIKIVFNLVVAPKYLKQPSDLSKVDDALQKLPEGLKYFENIIGSKKYLIKDQFSIADITLFSFLIDLRFTYQMIDADKYPNLVRYIAGIEQEPSVQKVMQQLTERLKNS